MAQPPLKKGALDSTDLGLGNRAVVTDGSGNLPAVNGGAVLNLNASALTTGTVPTGRLTGTYNIDISGDAATLGGNNSAYYTDATNLLTGTVPVARMAGTYNINISGDANTLDGNDSTFFRNAANLNAGTVPTGRLSGTYSIDIGGNAATATTAADSNLLDGLDSTHFTNASNLATGTLPTARLPASGVVAGSYATADITVDAAGRVTAAAAGSAAPSTAQVLTATAGANAGGVGTYAHCFHTTGTSYAFGATIGGSALVPLWAGGTSPFLFPGTLTGTWRCMGEADSSGTTTLWLRIA